MGSAGAENATFAALLSQQRGSEGGSAAQRREGPPEELIDAGGGNTESADHSSLPAAPSQLSEAAEPSSEPKGGGLTRLSTNGRWNRRPLRQRSGSPAHGPGPHPARTARADRAEPPNLRPAPPPAALTAPHRPAATARPGPAPPPHRGPGWSRHTAARCRAGWPGAGSWLSPARFLLRDFKPWRRPPASAPPPEPARAQPSRGGQNSGGFRLSQAATRAPRPSTRRGGERRASELRCAPPLRNGGGSAALWGRDGTEGGSAPGKLSPDLPEREITIIILTINRPPLLSSVETKVQTFWSLQAWSSLIPSKITFHLHKASLCQESCP